MMKIAILLLTTEQYNANQFYNSQAEGMAKAFVKYGHNAVVYHMIPCLEEECIEQAKDGIIVKYIRCTHLGKHALVPLNRIDNDIQLLILCSDNCIDFRRVYRWAERRKIPVAPYVGVLRSNNSSKWKRYLIDKICSNISTYCKIPVIVKTPAIKNELLKYGAKDITVIPVGLDETLLKNDVNFYFKTELRKKWGYTVEDKVLLFIGRMTVEKNPLEIIEILEKLVENDISYKLFMVGKGELETVVEQRIKERQLTKNVQWIKKIENDHIWELYRLADWFVNLNDHEIFGMSILEAMYYGCTVIAKHGPGPDYIISDGIDGFLCNKKEEIVELIQRNDDKELNIQAKKTIRNKFLWSSIASQFLSWKEYRYD